MSDRKSFALANIPSFDLVCCFYLAIAIFRLRFYLFFLFLSGCGCGCFVCATLLGGCVLGCVFVLGCGLGFVWLWLWELFFMLVVAGCG